VQVRPVEPGDDHRRIPHAELLGDVGSDRSGRRGGQGQHRRVAEPFDHVAQPQVVGPEVVTPRGHAMGLVHDEQGGLRLLQPREHVLLRQLFG
jgi:hypothetical protein